MTVNFRSISVSNIYGPYPSDVSTISQAIDWLNSVDLNKAPGVGNIPWGSWASYSWISTNSPPYAYNGYGGPVPGYASYSAWGSAIVDSSLVAVRTEVRLQGPGGSCPPTYWIISETESSTVTDSIKQGCSSAADQPCFIIDLPAPPSTAPASNAYFWLIYWFAFIVPGYINPITLTNYNVTQCPNIFADLLTMVAEMPSGGPGCTNVNVSGILGGGLYNAPQTSTIDYSWWNTGSHTCEGTGIDPFNDDYP